MFRLAVLGKNAGMYNLSYNDNTYEVSAGKWIVYINEVSDGRKTGSVNF